MVGILSLCYEFLRNKKAEVFFLCFSSMLVDVLLSRNGPPSCWRAKPIIKAKLWHRMYAEHNAFHFLSGRGFSSLPQPTL
jgi:hypothetical protein